MKSKFTIIYRHGTGGTFISNILDYYQKNSIQSLNFGLTPEGEAYGHPEDHKRIRPKDHMCDNNEELKNIKIENPDKLILLIDFHEDNVEFITRMYWHKLYKKTLTKERYEYCRGLSQNGESWNDFDTWQDDETACRQLFEMHEQSYMPVIKRLDRSLIDYSLPLDDIFHHPELNQKIANWCDAQPDSLIEEYIERYRTLNTKLYSGTNFRL